LSRGKTRRFSVSNAIPASNGALA
jgi:hypothetical protein